MWQTWRREWRYLCREPWDFCLTVVAPLVVVIVFIAMFAEGKTEHLPIALVDQDHSQLSREIHKHLSLNPSVKIVLQTDNMTEVERAIKRTDVWGYVLIPKGAEVRMVAWQDPNIAIAFNQSYFSIGNSISSAMMVSSLEAIADFGRNRHLNQLLPQREVPTPQIKVSTLYNPDMSYELFLEPFVVPAILHLLLCCCVAFAIGQELKRQTLHIWLQDSVSVANALFGKISLYVLLFEAWTLVWMAWLVGVRGWFVAGSWALLVLAQLLFYFAYACISATVVLATRDLARTFGFLAVYGGSSLSFAGVTLPLHNASWFTQFWSMIIPYTPYIRLQTEQWVVGSPVNVSLNHVWVLLAYCVVYGALAWVLLQKIARKATQ